jgi:hypothetical protein
LQAHPWQECQEAMQNVEAPPGNALGNVLNLMDFVLRLLGSG